MLGMENEVISLQMVRKKEETMKRFLRELEHLFSAISFAEAGEFESAREILREETNDMTCDTRIARKTDLISSCEAKEQKA